MGAETDISWTLRTWSPWHGCQRVSPGCQFCYAETQSKRYGLDIWGPPSTTNRRLLSENHWRQPLVWNRKAAERGERETVFPSMCDPFELHPQITGERARMFDLIRATPNLDWLLLTKRPELIDSLLPPGYWSNVWLGTSTENQKYANLRVPRLLQHHHRVPVLFLSVEPQIGPVNLDPWLHPVCPMHNTEDVIQCAHAGWNEATRPVQRLGWVIDGGESGVRHRPFDIAWARLLRNQCAKAGVAFHFKQHGGRTHAAGGCLIDGEEVKQFPVVRVA